MVIAHHLILTGYGHWLANDPRGSYSHETFPPELRKLAATHFGRRTDQPTRQELRAFYRKARRYLAHDTVWFEDAQRTALVRAFGELLRMEGQTCYACAVLSNHVHILLRKHRLKGERMLSVLKEARCAALHASDLAPADHPVFNAGSCDLYKSDPHSVRTCVRYIESHYRKHRLRPIPCDFVVAYDGWPHHKRSHAPRKQW